MNELSHVELPRTAMIGVGNMGGAILEGLREPEVDIARPITVTTRSAASAARFEEASDVVAYASETEPSANRLAVRDAGVVVLGVKPWMIRDTVAEIAGDLEPGTIVISLAAGITCATIEALVPEGVQVVRAMPNTPSQLGLGVTGVAGGASASPEAVSLAERMFSTVGLAIAVSEAQISDVAAVSGSGPAYLFLYAEEMMGAARRLGFSDDDADALVRATLLGSATLLAQSELSPEQLRRNVTSPKGTTEKAVEELQTGNWGELFDRALAANVRRSEELAAE